MSLYKRVYTPNSPLMPLSPMYPIASPSMFLSPYTTSIRSRRSFTPNHLNVLPPPSLSPIQAGILSNKRKLRDPFEPERRLNRTTTVLSSSQKNMKKVRSSVRKLEVRTARSRIPLTPIRRTLFGAESPPIVTIESPRSSAALTTPQSKYQTNATPQMFLSPAARYEYYEEIISPQSNIGNGATPSLLEETFTVMSILKEINMQKYVNLFVKEEVDLFVFLMLTNEDMAELGINEDDRPILTNAINCYTEFFGNPDKSIL